MNRKGHAVKEIRYKCQFSADCAGACETCAHDSELAAESCARCIDDQLCSLDGNAAACKACKWQQKTDDKRQFLYGTLKNIKKNKQTD